MNVVIIGRKIEVECSNSTSQEKETVVNALEPIVVRNCRNDY